MRRVDSTGIARHGKGLDVVVSDHLTGHATDQVTDLLGTDLLVLELLVHEGRGKIDVGFCESLDKASHGKKVDTIYRMAVCRSASDEERKLGIQSLRQLESAWKADPDKALETYCHMIFNSAAFLYVD